MGDKTPVLTLITSYIAVWDDQIKWIGKVDENISEHLNNGNYFKKYFTLQIQLRNKLV